MRFTGWMLVAVPLLLTLDEARAQVLVFPGSFGYASSGFGGVYRSRHLTIGGFASGGYFAGGYSVSPYATVFAPGLYPIAPIGFSQTRVTVNNIFPQTIVVAPVRDELAGVDLDLHPPANWAGPAGPPRFREVRPPAERAPMPLPAPNVKEPPAVPAAPAPPPPPPPPARSRPFPEPAPPAKDEKVESARQLQAGIKAFAAQEYGLAAQRFRQAFLVDPNNARAAFLLAQAQFALGKFRDAFRTIEDALDADPDWPRADFRPRLQLYDGHKEEFVAQLKTLEEALAKKPADHVLLFLEAYQLWFDGRRDDAVAMFMRARAVTLDTIYIDRFLRAAAPGAVASAK